MKAPYKGPRLARVRPEDTPIPRYDNFLPRSLTEGEKRIAGTKSEFRKAQEIIARKCADPGYSLGDVSKELGKSERTVQRLLEKSGSAGFRAELHEARMQRGAKMLASNSTVQEIAKAVGFKGAMHFAKAFRRWSGQSPTEYRESLVSKSS